MLGSIVTGSESLNPGDSYAMEETVAAYLRGTPPILFSYKPEITVHLLPGRSSFGSLDSLKGH